MGRNIDELIAKVEETNNVADSLIVLVKSLHDQIDAVVSGQVPAAVQAKIDAAFDSIEAQRQEIADAVVANTPSEAPEEPVEPPVEEPNE